MEFLFSAPTTSTIFTENPRKRPFNQTQSYPYSQSPSQRLRYNFPNMPADLKKKKKYTKTSRIKKPMSKKRYLQKIMKPEIKRVDSFANWATTSSASFRFCLSSCPGLGLGSMGERIGSRTQPIALVAKGSIAQPNTIAVADGCRRIRVVLVQFNNVNGITAPNPGSIFDLTVITDYTLAQINNGIKKTTKILRDEIFEMDKVSGEIYNFDWYVPLKGITQEFVANTGAYTDSRNYGWCLYVLPGNDTELNQDGFISCLSLAQFYIDV